MKQTVYRYEYQSDGNRIRCIRAREEEVNEQAEAMKDLAAWGIVIAGLIICGVILL
ncbi:hypothetical protein DFQ01_14452 [Paenibacillus cellulosilyticus]|uniref:Uncharacterized protein n=1 Tax=Paenibacillus cellulosilyticus TaxID=375489 RepID=A0A2V2YE14_9BACL|nr:hypothetical protein [Paenibacillus cellulosilyticus]PWV90276.1 hypothetical protein DFQ01_14452 [Paenibacillus cellulosilyticus]QKS43432.1 hypothetical protein HUB94_02615 [Paenibacillus cellulosilyticus]